MKTEKRLVLFLIISAAILLLSRSIMPPAPTTVQPNVSQQMPMPAQPSGPDLIPVVPEEQRKQAVLGDYIVNYSASGGYITDVYLEDNSTRLPIENVFYTPELATALFKVDQSADTLTFTYDTPTGVVIKEYSFIDPFALEVKLFGMDKFSNVILFEQPDDATGPSARYQELVYRTDALHKKASSSINKAIHLDNLEYIGMRGRYYAAAVINPEGSYTVNRVDHRLRLAKQELSEGSTRIFLGPQTGNALSQYDLEDMVSYGLLTPIVAVLKAILDLFARIFNNWGVSIILLAVVVYGICFPLTAKSTKSMRKMQEFQPHFEALREKHKDDPQRLQKEMIELYRKYQINPMSGCLPLLLQMPVFISLYQLMFRLPELQGANFLWINDLSRPDYLITLPVSLPLVGDGIHLLPVIMGALTFLQQKYTTKPSNMTEQQQMMLWLMPIMLLFIFYRFPAALVLYWMTNSILTFSYQLYLNKASK